MEASVRNEAAESRADLAELERQLQAAPKQGKAALERKVVDARARAAAAARDLQRLEGGPIVEVGCLEEAVVNMEEDDSGVWGQVVFVPSGSLSDAAGEAAAEDVAKARTRRWGWGRSK